MRVWIISDRRYGESTERCFEVEWWGLRTDPEDPDTCPCYQKSFLTEAAAKAYAKVAAERNDNEWGVALVTEMELTQVKGHHWDWESAGETVEVIATEKAP